VGESPLLEPVNSPSRPKAAMVFADFPAFKQLAPAKEIGFFDAVR